MYHLRPSQGVGEGLGSDVIMISTGMPVGMGVSSGFVGLLVGEPWLQTSSYGQLTFTPNDCLQHVCIFSKTTSSLSYSPLLVHFSPLEYHLRPPSQASHGVGATVASTVVTSIVGSAERISGEGVVGLAVGLGLEWVGLLVVGLPEVGTVVVGSAVRISGIVGMVEVGAADVGFEVIGADVVGDSVMISVSVGESVVGAAEVGSGVTGANVISVTVGVSEVGAAEVGSEVTGADVITSGVNEGLAVVGSCSLPIGLAVDGLGVGELVKQTSS